MKPGFVIGWTTRATAIVAGLWIGATAALAIEPTAAEHPIDRLLQPYAAKHQVPTTDVVSDQVFVRRVYLDLVGLLPRSEQVQAFMDDQRPQRRERLVQSVLADRRAYAEHWMTFWNDVLRNAYRGTGFIDGGRKQLTGWLFRSLYDNKPYDQLVEELVDPVPGSEGFIRGIQWRGVVNASQRREMQAAQNVAQVFLGTNLKCASCHDSFVNDWTLREAYQLASVFADQPLELHRCDKPTGETAQAAFIYPQLGAIDPQAGREERVRQLAGILTSRDNLRLARTIVNRLWANLMGRAIVEPIDDLDAEPWHAELLDWLAADLVRHDYDLKQTMQTICSSGAYQLPSVDEARTGADPFVFRGPLVKRMTAEQFIDAVGQLTHRSPPMTDGMLKADGRGQGGQLTALVEAFAAGDGVEKIEPKSWWEEGPEPRVRAVLTDAEPLSSALGRPIRDQVVTRRDSAASLLMALELTNGTELDRILKQGAEWWLDQFPHDRQAMVQSIYSTALGRVPTSDEQRVAVELLSDPTTPEGISDLLWVVTMLPEFQLY